MYPFGYEVLVVINFKLCDVVQPILTQVPYLLSEDIVTLVLMHISFSVLTLYVMTINPPSRLMFSPLLRCDCGRTGGQTSRGGGRTGEPTSIVGGQAGDQDGPRGDQGIGVNGGDDEVPDFSTVIAQQLQDLLPTIIAQVGNHASNIQGDVRCVNVSTSRNGCSYKDFMACNLKDYDGKGGAIVYTRWIEKIESVKDMSGCGANQKIKYTSGLVIGKALTWWNT
ncbi:hypothetical protein Tco_0857069 [Tanacetum coccineum]|uniref:Reverse transcriptase domain-containing protein n=1 Tax=Tanacetum coccineum TaxID=301880 RepID=A0ABQ5B7Y2_9ASTR